MMGLVLAAGSGQRLLPETRSLPKTLIPVTEDQTILDVVLRNLATVGIEEAAVVVGHCADAVRARVPDLQDRHGIKLRLIDNDHIAWNNAYSLWLARETFGEDVLLVNGDTVHPVSVERALLDRSAVAGGGVLLAVDSVKQLTDEAMKVQLSPDDRLLRITKAMPVADADGEYIGVALLHADIAADLTACLADTWRADPRLYYEDALQLLADRAGAVAATHVGRLEWVEVDDHADLARAREIACRY